VTGRPPRDSSIDRALLGAARQLVGAPRLLSARLAAFGGDEQVRLIILAGAIGAAAGLAVLVFYSIIDLIQGAVLRGAASWSLLPLLAIPGFVALGLVASRALVRWGAGGSSGENIPDVMYRVSVKGGVMHLRPVLAKTLAAAAVIGTGGSVGPEGPVIVLGAATASRIGRWLDASPNRLRTLVGCGAAAGLSAAFNAPIAGVIFGVEKILGAAGGMALGPFVVASIIAAAVSRAAFGEDPVMVIPQVYDVGAPVELLFYAGLGLVTGLVGVAFTKAVWRAHDAFARVPRRWIAVVLGALVVGGLDIAFRADLWGQGHESLDLAIMSDRTALFLLGLAVAKLVATAVTRGAGGAGGVFTPALFVGATCGGALALSLTRAVPSLQLVPGALALAGMAGVVAAATHAPLTAVMMVFEMTGDYALILPLLLTSAIAYVVARRSHPESVYTEWLVRRGVVLSHGADAAVLARLPVSECLHPRPVVVPADAGVSAIGALTAAARQTEFPVVDADGRLLGMLSQLEVREAAEGGERLGPMLLAADLVHPNCARVSADDTLLTALRRLGDRDVNWLPVVGADDRDRLVGVVSRQDLLAAYERHLHAEEGEDARSALDDLSARG